MKHDEALLLRAAEEGLPEVVAEMARRGADLNARNAMGRTPLLIAVRRGDRDTAKALIELGADLEAESDLENGWTALAFASSQGLEGILADLVQGGANLGAKGDLGQTPLMLAAMWGHEACARALLDAGADWLAKDADGETAEDRARIHGEAACESLLMDWRIAAAEKGMLTVEVAPTLSGRPPRRL